METETIRIGVIMQRLALANRWQPHQWRPLEIVDHALLPQAAHAGALCLRNDADDMRWLFTGFEIKLFRDEAEGYFLNLSARNPCWFIMWRMEEIAGQEVAVPKSVTLSYNEAARLMDGGEQVDTLPLPATMAERLAAFTQQHYHPEPKKKRSKPSFEGGAAVERMAKAEGKPDGR